MKDKAIRSWAARCTYKGRKDFYLGTVVADQNAKEHEVLSLFHKLWERTSPYPFPDSYIVVPGIIIFVPEKES